MRAKKNKRNFSLAMRHTQEILYIDLIIVKLIWSFSCVFFSLQGERVFYVNIYIFVCDYYFELIILMVILFGT